MKHADDHIQHKEVKSYVVVGGGVAGVSCAKTLCGLRPEDKVVMISPEDVFKVCRRLFLIWKYEIVPMSVIVSLVISSYCALSDRKPGWWRQ